MRIALITALLAASLPLCAQIDNGNITGRVTDPTGAPVFGAQVNVTQTETNFVTNTSTNVEGIYRALSLRPGPYRVTVTAAGFKTFIRDGIQLRIGQTLAVDGSLALGEAFDSVQVNAKAGLLETETSSGGATLAGDYFYNLPNYQKHATAILLFMPGVTFGSNQYTKGVSGMTIDGLGGSNGNGIGYFEDGAVATMGARGDNAETVANSIEDIKVFTSAMPAEFGHSAGVGISVVKKTGTNQFHGSLHRPDPHTQHAGAPLFRAVPQFADPARVLRSIRRA